MSGSTLIALPQAGQMTLWRLVEAGQPLPSRRPIAAFCFGVLLTGGAVTTAWPAMRPDTTVQTRIVADGSAGRAVLSDMALRLSGATGPTISLQAGGQALVVAVQDHDPAVAAQRSRSLTDAILDAPVTLPRSDAGAEPISPEAGLRAERDRVAGDMAAVEARASAASTSLTALARDLAAANRPADQKPGHETLDKGNAALADLQLQRLQLVAKYQDTYPAVVALDGQIRNLHVFLADEAQRIQTRPASNEAAIALLNTERDRLRAELTQMDDRRRTLASQMAGFDRDLAALPTGLHAPAAPAMAPPLLVVATTTTVAGPDIRPMVAGIAVAIGILLSGFVALLARRRRARPGLHGVMLEPVPGGMLTAGSLRALPPNGFPPLVSHRANALN